MLHGTEEMYNAEAAVLKAAAEGWSIDRLSGSTTTQVRVYDQSYIDRLSGSTTQVRVYDKGSYSDSNMSCSCEYNISASAQVGKSAPQSAFDTVMAAFFRRKTAYSIIIKDLSTGARVQSFHELSIGQRIGHKVVTTRYFQYEEAKICYNSLRRMFRRERSVLDSTSRFILSQTIEQKLDFGRVGVLKRDFHRIRVIGALNQMMTEGSTVV